MPNHHKVLNLSRGDIDEHIEQVTRSLIITRDNITYLFDITTGEMLYDSYVPTYDHEALYEPSHQALTATTDYITATVIPPACEETYNHTWLRRVRITTITLFIAGAALTAGLLLWRRTYNRR